MGMQWSKEGDHVLKSEVERIKSCMHNHENSVHGIDCAVNAQNDSVQLLERALNELKSGHEDISGSMDITKNLLCNIQKSLVHQVKAVTESFSILDHCIQEISERFNPETESPPLHTEKRHLESQRTGASKDRKDNIVFDRRSSSGTNSKRGTDGDDKEKIKALRKENDAFSANNNQLLTKLKLAEDEMIELKSKIDRMRHFEEEARCVSKDKDYFEKENVRLQNVNKRLTDEKIKHEHNANRLDSKSQQLEREKKYLENEVGKLRRQMKEIEEEKRKMKERKMIVPVQLFYQRKDELMTLVVNELSSMLHTQMQTKGMQLDLVTCDNISNIQPDKPILVLCINSSRLGTDATTAIEGVHKSGRTALLIFHHKNIHALPNQPSDRMLTSAEFKQLGGIVDLAFLTGKGIYPCDMNNVAVSCIESFIQRNCPGQQ